MFRPTLVRANVARWVHSNSTLATSYNLKYADKLYKKAQEKGLDLEKLVSQAREEARCKQQTEAATLLASFKKTPTEHSKTPSDTRDVTRRRDSSPAKPLSSILNISKLLATPHTSSQISALWTAYHASRNKGTGRGYVCASLSLDSYNAMMRVAKEYPVFVIPIPREPSRDPSVGESTGSAHEFFFLQWDFHSAPVVPSAADPDPFERIKSGSSSHLPKLSTVLFTPLQEYKLHTSFATPYLVLTFYTDISQSHGIVLLRGEITPSPQQGKEVPERFLLNQVDAQLLVMGLQRFYLWGEGEKDGKKDGDHHSTAEALLHQFHEEPEQFNWQELLESFNLIV